MNKIKFLFLAILIATLVSCSNPVGNIPVVTEPTTPVAEPENTSEQTQTQPQEQSQEQSTESEDTSSEEETQEEPEPVNPWILVTAADGESGIPYLVAPKDANVNVTLKKYVVGSNSGTRLSTLDYVSFEKVKTMTLKTSNIQHWFNDCHSYGDSVCYEIDVYKLYIKNDYNGDGFYVGANHLFTDDTHYTDENPKSVRFKIVKVNGEWKMSMGYKTSATNYVDNQPSGLIGYEDITE